MIETKQWLKLKEDVLGKFLAYFEINPRYVPGYELLEQVSRAFSYFPYENLTKIIKAELVVSASSARRDPDEVVKGFLDFRTGGTCFSLTSAFIAILTGLGFKAYPILADRSYGSDTHCALIIEDPIGYLLLDPGFLIYTPVLLPTLETVTFPNGFNRIHLVPHSGGRKVELKTEVKNNFRSRLMYRIDPVGYGDFLTAWDRTFGWEMMTYPVLTTVSSERHIYLQDNIIRIRDHDRSNKEVLKPEKSLNIINSLFGIDQEIIKRAFEVINYGRNR